MYFYINTEEDRTVCRISYIVSYYPRFIHLSFLSSEKAPETSAEVSQEAEIKDEKSTEDTQVILHSQLRAVLFIFNIRLETLFIIKRAH